MKSKTKVVVIGGGVVGVSTLYHLAKKGWSDVALVERKELTSGSTWHAAGLLPLFNMSYSVGQLHKYAVNFYKTLEEETGQNVGFSVVSNIRLASNKDRMDEYHQYAGVAQTIGVEVKFLSPEQVKEIWPLCNTEGLIGAIQHPEDGYIQPADLTQALATGARNRGAEIYRNTSVIGIKQSSNGWVVETDKGTKEYNYKLSIERANVVKNLLIDLGIKEDNIKILGKGEIDLNIKTNDEVPHPANRRAEISPIN